MLLSSIHVFILTFEGSSIVFNMAADTETNDLTFLNFRLILEELDCPLVKDCSDDWLEELCFKQGNNRLMLLEWLLNKFHPELNSTFPQILEDDSEEKKINLLFLASSLGLCSPDDTKIITGTASKQRLKVFMRNLLNLVHSKYKPPHKSDAFASAVILMNSLANQNLPSHLFNAHVSYLPINIVKQISSASVSSDIAYIKTALSQVSMQIEEQTKRLQQLHHNDSILPSCVSNIKVISTAVNLILSELSQLSSTLLLQSQDFHSLNIPAQNLVDLGFHFKFIYNLLIKFTALLKSCSVIKNSQNHLKEPLRFQEWEEINMGLKADEILSIYHSCIEVFEDTFHRKGNK